MDYGEWVHRFRSKLEANRQRPYCDLTGMKIRVHRLEMARAEIPLPFNNSNSERTTDDGIQTGDLSPCLAGWIYKPEHIRRKILKNKWMAHFFVIEEKVKNPVSKSMSHGWLPQRRHPSSQQVKTLIQLF